MNELSLTVEDIGKIKNQNRLLEIVRNRDLETRIRTEAVKNLEDKGVFRDFAHDEDMFMRMCAAEYVDDDEILLDLILNDSNDYVRREAGRNFVYNCDCEKYEGVLLEFALENPKYNVSPLTRPDIKTIFACRRISDTSKLLKIIKESKSRQVYGYAMDAVGRDALSGLLHSGELDMEKTVIVAEKLEDTEKLRELLYSGKLKITESLRIAAKLEDSEKLMKLLEVPVGPYIPDGKVFPDLFPGDRIYTSIALSYPDEEVAAEAVKNIGYKQNMEWVINNSKNARIRRLAEERLKNL